MCGAVVSNLKNLNYSSSSSSSSFVVVQSNDADCNRLEGQEVGGAGAGGGNNLEQCLPLFVCLFVLTETNLRDNSNEKKNNRGRGDRFLSMGCCCCCCCCCFAIEKTRK